MVRTLMPASAGRFNAGLPGWLTLFKNPQATRRSKGRGKWSRSWPSFGQVCDVEGVHVHTLASGTWGVSALGLHREAHASGTTHGWRWPATNRAKRTVSTSRAPRLRSQTSDILSTIRN